MENTNIYQKLSLVIRGKVDTSTHSREFYSHDASMFELLPKAIVFPKDSHDVQKLVKFVSQNKPKNKDLSITPRSAGTDMTGGAINESIIMDMTKHFDKIINVNSHHATVLPGMHYRDFEKKDPGT